MGWKFGGWTEQEALGFKNEEVQVQGRLSEKLSFTRWIPIKKINSCISECSFHHNITPPGAAELHLIYSCSTEVEIRSI